MRTLLFLCPLILACSNPTPPATQDDLARPTTDGGPPNPGDGGGTRVPLFVVATSDFTSGGLSTVEVATQAVRKNIDTIDPQSVVRVYGGLVYVLDQTHGLLRIYDPEQGFGAPREIAIGSADVPAAQANPYDIYVDSARRAYVILYGSFGSTKVTGQRALGVLQLDVAQPALSFVPLQVAAADPDNNPDAARLFACGRTLYVLLQDLDRVNGYVPAGPARLAAVDLAKDPPQVASYLQLAGQNPTSVSIPEGDCGQVLISHSDNQLSAVPSGKGGIERLDLIAGKSLGLIMSDKDLGGIVSTLDAKDLRHVYISLITKSGMRFDHTIHQVDLMGKSKGAALLGPLPYVPQLRVHEARLLVLAAGIAAPMHKPTGLYVGTADGQPLAAAPLDVGLPPLSLDVYR